MDSTSGLVGLVPRNQFIPFYNLRNLEEGRALIMSRFADWEILSREEVDQLHDVFVPEALVERLQNKRLLLTSINAQELLTASQKWDADFYKGPYLYIIHLTQRCNFGCSYCHSSAISMSAKGRDLTLEKAEQICDFIAKTQTDRVTINFQGGEPFARLDLIEFICSKLTESVGQSKPLIFSITTNGSLIDEAAIELIRRYRISVTVSIDGPAEVHNRFRTYKDGTGSYDDVVAGRKRLLDADIGPVGSIMVITKDNLGRVFEIVDEYLSMGFQNLFLKPVTKLGHAKGEWDNLAIDVSEWSSRYLECVDYIFKKQPSQMACESQYAIAIEKLITGRNTTYVDARAPCGVVHGVLNFDIDGKIYGCHEGKRNRAFLIGTSVQNPLDVLHNQASRHISRAGVLDQYPACRACSYIGVCSPCVAHSYQSTAKMEIRPLEDWECKSTMLIYDDIFHRLSRSDPAIMNWIRYALLRDILSGI